MESQDAPFRIPNFPPHEEFDSMSPRGVLTELRRRSREAAAQLRLARRECRRSLCRALQLEDVIEEESAQEWDPATHRTVLGLVAELREERERGGELASWLEESRAAAAGPARAYRRTRQALRLAWMALPEDRETGA